MTAEYVRPDEAARRFRVSRATLWRWANRGLIGTARVGGIRMYVAGDIADVIARAVTPRTVVPIGARPVAAVDDWRSDPFWADAEAAR